MTLKAGTHLGPHEILSLLGAGGMGEVLVLWKFIASVFRHWVYLLTSSGMVAALGIWERWSRQNVPWYIYVGILTVGALVACFLAWHDEHMENQDLRAELTRKRPIDAAKEQEVKTWLADFSDEEKKLLNWLLLQGETEVTDIFSRSGFSKDVINAVLEKGRKCGLIKNRPEPPDKPTRSYWNIHHNYTDALTSLLHPW